MSLRAMLAKYSSGPTAPATAIPAIFTMSNAEQGLPVAGIARIAIATPPTQIAQLEPAWPAFDFLALAAARGLWLSLAHDGTLRARDAQGQDRSGELPTMNRPTIRRALVAALGAIAARKDRP